MATFQDRYNEYFVLFFGFTILMIGALLACTNTDPNHPYPQYKYGSCADMPNSDFGDPARYRNSCKICKVVYQPICLAVGVLIMGLVFYKWFVYG